MGDAVHVANSRLEYGATNINPITCLNGDFDEDGYGIRHYKPVVGTVPLIWEGEFAEEASHASAHLIFARASDRPDQQDFIKRFIFKD